MAEEQQEVTSTKEPSWSMSNERAFIENLLCQRFNFMLVFYILIIAASFTTESQTNFIGVLTLGALTCIFLMLPIARAQFKLDLIIDHFKDEDPEHVALKIDERANDLMEKLKVARKKPWGEDRKKILKDYRKNAPRILHCIIFSSRRRMVGYWIPLFFIISLWIMAILSWFCVLRVKY